MDQKEPTRAVVATVRLTKDAHSQIVDIAKRKGVSQSTVLWWAALAYIKKASKEKQS